MKIGKVIVTVLTAVLFFAVPFEARAEEVSRQENAVSAVPMEAKFEGSVELDNGIICEMYSLHQKTDPLKRLLRGYAYSVTDVEYFTMRDTATGDVFGTWKQTTRWSVDESRTPIFMSGTDEFISPDPVNNYVSTISRYTSTDNSAKICTYSLSHNAYHNNIYVGSATFSTRCNRYGVCTPIPSRYKK